MFGDAVTRGPIYHIPIARKVGSGLECPACKTVLHDSDDKSTGWASRAYFAHFVNEHDPLDLNAGVDFWSGQRALPPEPFVSWQEVINLARKQLDTLVQEDMIVDGEAIQWCESHQARALVSWYLNRCPVGKDTRENGCRMVPKLLVDRR